ncbi:hypothetical protein H5410_065011, partial [Solanum commersonii]
NMDGGPPADRFRPPNPVREEAIHTDMAEKELDGTRTYVPRGDSSQIRGTRANEMISQSHEVQDGQKSSESHILFSRTQSVTAARSVGESPQRRSQDCNIQEVIQPEYAIGDCNTGQVSSSFHGGNIRRESSGNSTGILATDSGKLVSADELRLLIQQKNPHREGKQPVQDLGQSSNSNVEDFNKKQSKESCNPSIDNSRPNVIPAYIVSTNEFHRIENDPSKAWVAKEQGNSSGLRPVPKSATTDRIDSPPFPSNTPKSDQVIEPALYTVVQTYADPLRHNQAKGEVSINLTAPEITTKQGLPAVLYVKEEIIKDLAATFQYTLIGKFSTTMPKVDLIRSNFILQTQLSGGVKIAYFNSRHVYIDLDNELDYNMVWTKQRMNILGKVMRIQVWTPSFKPDEETPIVPIWISLPELPWHCYNKEFVTGLLSLIGKVLYLDSASIKKTRGSQARVKVQVDLSQKRPPYIWMGYIGEDITDGRWQKIEYDNIPEYCFYCKHQGHVENDCTIRQKDAEKKKKEMDNVRSKSTKDMDTNQHQPKGYKDSGPNDDTTNLYNQQKD